MTDWSRYVASRPARIFLDPFVWWRHDRVRSIGLALALAAMLAASGFAWQDGGLENIIASVTLGVALAAFNVVYWHGVRDFFHRGDLCPAVVLSVAPVTLAVFTDLAADGQGSYPAIKVVERDTLREVQGEPVQEGMTLTCVALYAPGPDHPRFWGDFEPQPAVMATEDQRTLERLHDALRGDEWAALDRGVRLIPPMPGLYRLWERS